MKKLILILAVLALVMGCRAKKTETIKEEVKQKDTISTVINTTQKEEVKENKTVTPPIIETVYIKEPCDEKGKIKPFHNIYNSGRGRVEVYTDSLGQIVVKIDLPEVINSDKQRNKENTRDAEKYQGKDYNYKLANNKVIEITPWRYWLYLIISLVANLVLLYLLLMLFFKTRAIRLAAKAAGR